MSHPLALPAAGNDWSAWITHRVHDQIAVAEASHAELKKGGLKDGKHRSAQDILELWNDDSIALHNAFAVTSLASQMHPLRAVRHVAEELQQVLTRLMTDRGQDRKLSAVLDGIDATGLDEER